jgi:GT2 family glycosyltransferase
LSSPYRRVIAFGICIGPSGKWERIAGPALDRVREADSLVLTLQHRDSIFDAYNELLDCAGARPDLEALVLLHDDVELNGDVCGTVRQVLADDSIAIVGVVGATDVRSLAWWEGDRRGRAVEPRFSAEFSSGVDDVDAVDGYLLVLSPWAVRSLRFDDGAFHGFHAYDLDICFQARAAGKRVVTAAIGHYHHTKGTLGDALAYAAADLAFRRKWRTASKPELWRLAAVLEARRVARWIRRRLPSGR